MRRPYLQLCAVTAGWGTIPVLVGWVNLPAPLIVAIRLWTAAACLGAVLLVQGWRSRRSAAGGGLARGGERVGTGRGVGVGGGLGVGAGVGVGGGVGDDGGWPRLFSVRPGWCVLVALILAAHWLALFAAYKRAPAGTVILIVYLAPLGVAALSPRLLGERLGWRTIEALAVATVGFCLVAAPTVQAAGTVGLILSLIAAALFVALILVSKPLASAYGGLRLAFIELAGAGLVLVPVAMASTWPPREAAWLWIVVLGIVHTAIGITLYLSVLAEIPATHVGILGYLEPVAVVLAAWVWLGQRPGLATVLGGLLVITAGAVVAATSAGHGPVAQGPARPQSTGSGPPCPGGSRAFAGLGDPPLPSP